MNNIFEQLFPIFFLNFKCNVKNLSRLEIVESLAVNKDTLKQQKFPLEK